MTDRERAANCAAKIYVNRESLHHKYLADVVATELAAVRREAREQMREEAAQFFCRMLARLGSNDRLQITRIIDFIRALPLDPTEKPE